MNAHYDTVMRLRRHWKLSAITLALWLLASLPVTLELYEYSQAREPSLSFLGLLFLQLLRFLPFALAVPFIFLLSGRLPLHTRNVAGNIGGAIVYIALANFTFTLFERGMRDCPPDEGFLASYASFLPARIAYGVVTYILVYVLSQLVHLYHDSQEQRLARAELERQLTDARLRALQHQLQPHFLFNTLHAISTLMEHDVTQARRMMALLGDLLRWSLKNDQVQEVALSQELEALDLYLEIERVRFQDRLTIEREIDPEAERAMVPFFLLQPLAENAITHGISKRSAAGRLQIQARAEGGELIVAVTDDGPGANGRHPGHGIGLSNLTERLERLYDARASLETESPPTGGFTTRVRLPLRFGDPSP